MYPTISDLIYDFTGIFIPLPIQTFGFCVVLSLLLAAYFTSKELKRKEDEGLLKVLVKKVTKGKPASTIDLLSSFIIGFLLGFKGIDALLNYSLFVDNPQEFILSTRGSILGGIGGGAILCYLKYREKEKEKLSKPIEETITFHPYELIGNIAIIAAVGGFLGAKIFHNLENIDELLADPLYALISFSGLTFYGGLIIGAIAVLYYAKKNSINPLHMVDAAAPALMLAYGVGRIGCQLSGDGDWGIVNAMPKPEWLFFLPDWTWAFDYPHNVISEGIRIAGCEGRHCFVLENTVFPTPLYESVLGILLFFVLWNLRKKIKVHGVLFSVYLILNGMERFFIEKIRVNSVYKIFEKEITQAEIISVVLIILGIFGIIFLKKNKNRIAI